MYRHCPLLLKTLCLANRSIAAMSPQFTPDVIGDYVVSLQVSDGLSVSDADFIVIDVVASDATPTAIVVELRRWNWRTRDTRWVSIFRP